MPIRRECVYTECPVEAALDLIGGRWRTMIIALLMGGTMRFNELERRLKGVTHRVLTAQLRDLERCGLVSRRVFPEVPPRVEYSLTEMGTSLKTLIDELKSWGVKYALNAQSSMLQEDKE